MSTTISHTSATSLTSLSTATTTIQLGSGDASTFGWFIIVVALIMAAGIGFAYKKQGVIRLKYVAAVGIMLFVGIKWLIDN